MGRIPTIKKISQSSDLGLPNYIKYCEEEYKSYLKKYKIISDNGLDIDEYIDTRKKAECIVNALGDKRVNIYNDKLVGYIFNYNELSIRLFKELQITFNGTEVLSDTKYYPGDWEEIVAILYKNLIPMLKEKKQKKQTIKNISLLASKIENDNGELSINSHLVIKKFDSYDRKDEFISHGVNVISYDEIVFENIESGFEYEYSLNKSISYNPGDWENEIKQYIQELEKNDYNDFLTDNKDLIEENIKTLKKKYY